MKKIAQALLKLDRRIIFLLMAIIAVTPVAYPKLVAKLPPLLGTSAVRGLFNSIDKLPEGSVVWVSFDFDPGSEPELRPMAVALVRHGFKKNLRVVGMNLWDMGVPIAETTLKSIADEFAKQGNPKEYGVDYVFLGWQPGTVAVITNLGINLFNTFTHDYYGSATKDMKIFEGIKSMKDVGYMVSLAAGTPGVEAWIVFGADRYKYKMGGGCTAVIEPGLRPFFNTKQITGLLGGMKGAAEYESMVERIDKGTEGINAISLPQFLIGILILVSSILYAIAGRAK